MYYIQRAKGSPIGFLPQHIPRKWVTPASYVAHRRRGAYLSSVPLSHLITIDVPNTVFCSMDMALQNVQVLVWYAAKIFQTNRYFHSVTCFQ